MSETNPSLVFHADNIGKSYKKRPVLRGISLSMKQGEIVGLLGPNGAGKTTCFYIMCGLIKPDYGAVYFDDHNITALPMHRRARLGIGYLPQEASIFRGLSVEDNIKIALEAVQLPKEKQEARLEELLGEFSIGHLRRTAALSLSGGERRRVEIARALATHPQFILLDEPFAGIDPIAVKDIQELVIHLKEKNIGILITDHNVRETLGIVDRAYILNDGVILTEGSPEMIIKHTDVRRVYLGENFNI
jgi:lipopolysaccharide export system ATP-binding protein